MGNSQSQGPPPGPMRPGPTRGPPMRWPRVEPPIQVLPHIPPVPLLRNTPNGAILQQGGTISSRPQQNMGPRPLRRPRSHSAHRPPQPESPDLTRCGSEPDLRNTPTTNQRNRENNRLHAMSRGRKKYRAPPAPQPGSGVESSSPDLNGWDATPRKARLFKTRAETNRRPCNDQEDHHRKIAQTLSLPRQEDIRPRRRESDWRRDNKEDKALGDAVSLPRIEGRERNIRRVGTKEDHTAIHRSRSQDALATNSSSLSTPEFQAELLEVAQKLRPRSALLPRPVYERNVNSPEPPIEPSPKTHGEPAKENAQPPKTFYFGMEESNKMVTTKVINSNVNKTNREHRLTAVEKSKNLMNLKHKQKRDVKEEVVAEKKNRQDDEQALEKFAANFQRTRAKQSTSGSSSLVSDPDPDEVDGIDLQLRPTLPKKQLEIPRFSPTAAWRLLSTDTVSSPSPDSERGISEERIPCPDSFPPPAVHMSIDKSGDSGISGDASPGGGHESSSELIDMPPKTIHVIYPNQQKSLLLAWTPEQDLEESSSEEESPLQSKMAAAPGAKLTTRGHLFSTLPRERIEEPQLDSGSRFNSLRHATHTSDSNWLLSRSVPGSLNSGHAPVMRTCSSPEQREDAQLLTKYPSFSYLAQGGHVVYLPEYKSRCSPDYNYPSPHLHLSRSCENISAEPHELQETSDTPWSSNMLSNTQQAIRSMTEHRPHKKKKFTFQSTVRLLENRRVAEKLSREAEFKETQRLSEVEAMRRVEEEFQRKRAREKASIRHQLRLFSLEEKEYTSLPPMDWGRAEPDGAPSSLPPGPTPRSGATTQVLSEFRETIRDYRDYRQPSYRRAESPDVNPDVPVRKHIVQHPRIIADMPKNLPVYVSALTSSAVTPSPRPRDNYRKEFAHGSVARTSSDSDSQPHTRPGSRQTVPHWTRLENEITRDSRSRSASPSPTAEPNSTVSQVNRPSSRSSSSPQESPTLDQRRSVSRSSTRSVSPDQQQISLKSRSITPEIPHRSRSNSPLEIHSENVRIIHVVNQSSGKPSPLQRTSISSPDIDVKEPALAKPKVAVVQVWGQRNSHSPSPRRRQLSKSSSHSRSRSASPKRSYKDSGNINAAAIYPTPNVESPGAEIEKTSQQSTSTNHVFLAGVKPFSKTVKSYRPIAFNPGTVAQIVT